MLTGRNYGIYFGVFIFCLNSTLLAHVSEFKCSGEIYKLGKENASVNLIKDEIVKIDFDQNKDETTVLRKTVVYEGRELDIWLSGEKTELDVSRKNEVLFGAFVLDNTEAFYQSPSLLNNNKTWTESIFSVFLGTALAEGLIFITGVVQFYVNEAKEWKVLNDMNQTRFVFKTPVAPIHKLKNLLEDYEYSSLEEVTQAIESMKSEWFRLECVQTVGS